MKILGIIAEYNPFHNGHKYQICKAKELVNPDLTIIAMSGSFVQRGGPSVFDKWSRAKFALENGADLVVEIPVSFSMASAERFAYGGVYLLNQLGITHLSFGAEDSLEELLNAVESIENKADKSEVNALAQEVAGKADAIVVGELSNKVDAIKLDEYAKKSDIPSLDDYATKDFVSEEIKKVEVPTKVSQLENDANYLTAHQDISGKQDVINDLETIRTGAALGATALQAIPEEYVTDGELAAKGYATIDQLNGKQDAIDDLTAIRSGAALGATALQAIPEEYVTDSELTAKGYLTEHQSLDNYYTKKEIDDKIDAINTLIGQAIDITNTILA